MGSYTVTFRVSGYYECEAAGQTFAEEVFVNADFGDLYDVDGELIDVDDNTYDFAVIGKFDTTVWAAENEEEAKKLAEMDFSDADFVELFDIDGEVLSIEKDELER